MSDAGACDNAALPAVKRLYGLVAEYPDVASLLEGARCVRDAGYVHWDAHAPIPVHGLDEAMGIRRTVLPRIVFGFGLLGALSGLGLAWYTNAVNYPFLVSGKPLLSIPAWVPVVFELTVLASALAAFFGMLLLNGLPRLYHAVFLSPRVSRTMTTDRFFISIEARDPKFSVVQTRALLESTPQEGIELIEEELGGGLPHSFRRWAVPVLVGICLVALIPPLAIAVRRSTTREFPRTQLFPDMDQQPKFKAQGPNPLFADGRAMRPRVAGTVAYGEGRQDDHLTRGIAGNDWAKTFPLPVTGAMLRRGREQFNIFCAQCHGLDGLGQGPVAVRAERLQEGTWVAPASLADDLVRSRPVGHLFHTISNGIRTMPPYGDQIAVEDRWAIVAYVRALQRAHRARVEDVPPEQRDALQRE